MCCEGVQDEGECRVADGKLRFGLDVGHQQQVVQEGCCSVVRGLVFALRINCQFLKGDLLYSNLWNKS